jgi:hypothetical protein
VFFLSPHRSDGRPFPSPSERENINTLARNLLIKNDKFSIYRGYYLAKNSILTKKDSFFEKNAIFLLKI